jgi:hypothetical protein
MENAKNKNFFLVEEKIVFFLVSNEYTKLN